MNEVTHEEQPLNNKEHIPII